MEHFVDGGESASEVGEGEVVLVLWSQERQDKDGIEVELEDVGFAVFGGVDTDRVLEHFGVAGDGVGRPLGGGHEGDKLCDDSVFVGFGVDATDDGPVTALEDIGEHVLSPHDAESAALV